MIELSSTVNRRYRVEREIGSGGMAVVYRGRDLVLGRDVAIKALRPQFAADPTVRSRFEREAQAAAGFSHPHIIDIYDVGEEGGTPYIIMEYIDGQTLKEIILNEAPFHPDDVAALLTQIGGALDYAHARGYVHRDVKPQNILVDRQGMARVVDFGIAKGLADSDLTEMGAGLGTVHYLSPEQASGLMPTPASDVYSAGVVAFEMLTHRLPFEADSPVAVALRQVQDPPPAPSSFEPGVPPAVDAIVLKALDKDPTKRFHNATALATAMSSWREARPRNVTFLPVRTPAPEPASPRAASEPPLTLFTPAAGQPVTTPAPAATEPDTPRVTVTPRTSPRDDVGCATWVVGLAILLGLIGLIWIGFQLTPRFTDLGGGIPGAVASPTTAAPTAAATGAAPTVTPIATTAPPVIGPVGESTVPDLTGMTLEGARDAVRAAGMQLTVLEPVFSDDVPVERVAEQDPPPDSPLEPGTTMYVKLSRGSAAIDLASLDLVGSEPAEAERTLTASGLGVDQRGVPSQDIENGLVAGTDPAERANIGETVTLLVSLGDVVKIPGTIQGETQEEATAALEEAGLVVTGTIPVGREPIEEAGIDPDDFDPGDVVGVIGEDEAHSIDLDAYVPRGTAIDLVVYDPDLETP